MDNLLLKLLNLDSMRSRYVFGAVLLSAIFVVSFWLTQGFISGAVSQTAKSTLHRNKLADSHRVIREHLWKAEFALQTYLVTPESKEYDLVIGNLSKALAYIGEIPQNQWNQKHGIDLLLVSLSQDLNFLKTSIVSLLDVRNDAEKLFPAYVTINEVMLPVNLHVNSQLNLVIEDLSARLAEEDVRTTYRQFNEFKDEWLKMIGGFRMYLASRAMSIRDSADAIKQYSTIIELHYTNLLNQIGLLERQLSQYDHGIQAENALFEINQSIVAWYAAFIKIKTFDSEHLWRMDEKLMSESIQPLQKKIWDTLHDFELLISQTSENDLNQLLEVTTDVNSVLWMRMLVALLFIVVAFFAFEYWVLRPVAKIAHALKLEAEGEEVKELPKANTLETRELVDAFDEMRSQVKIRQLELEHQAMHDNLTGLPNRLFLRRSLIDSIENEKQHQGQLALLMVDLNRFKEINDTLGHHMGDRVLKEIGPRFRSVLAEHDVLARLGGDEFAILLPNTNAERAYDVAKRLSKSLDVDFIMDGQLLRVGSSIGIALYPKHGNNEQSLLQRADVAMYLAKHKNLRYAVYDEAQDEHNVWQLSFEGELLHAIEEDLLELHYQPKVNVKTNSITGVEALLRWNHKDHGLVPADEIHLLAEKTGLIKPLTRWVINKIVQQLADWQKKGIDINVSANLSVWNLQDPKLFECVKDQLREWNVAANKMTMEITESAVMSDPDSAVDTLNQLSRLGVQLSIDDFGIGFSSLEYLKKLPVNELKIDKSFVMDMIIDENDAVIVRSTIDLAHNLGLKVVAEGVESQEIYDVLDILGCDQAQGFLMSQSMSADDLESWVYQSKWGLGNDARLCLVN